MADKNSNLNIKIGIITAVIVVWVVCLALILSQCDTQNEKTPTNTHPDAQTVETAYKLPDYETKNQGTVSREESKTLAYFTSHYSGDYYRVKEYAITSATDGEYYQTETVAYSTQGYLYRKLNMTSYNEQDLYDDSVVSLYTPDAAYAIYPWMKSYMTTEGSTQGYTNEISFSDEEFITGDININGREYYYEEVTGEDGTDAKYCYDENGELKFRIVATDSISIMESYKEYTKDVDYSLFEVPADYTLQE